MKWFANHPDWIEKFYSKGIYIWISQFFRSLFGWIPFSVGEIIYTLLFFLIFRYLILKRKKIKALPLSFLRDTIMVLSVFYFTFHLLWGLNYYRTPLSETLSIKEEASFEEIKGLTKALLVKTNELQLQITGDSITMVKVPYTRNEIFEKTISSYNEVDRYWPF